MNKCTDIGDVLKHFFGWGACHQSLKAMVRKYKDGEVVAGVAGVQG